MLHVDRYKVSIKIATHYKCHTIVIMKNELPHCVVWAQCDMLTWDGPVISQQLSSKTDEVVERTMDNCGEVPLHYVE